MLLAVDIGNSHSVLGLFQDGELRRRWRVTTEAHRTADEIAVQTAGLLRLEGMDVSSVEDVIVSSVVPNLNAEYQSMARTLLHVEPITVGPGIRTGMPVLTDNPREVGPDLIVGAVAGYALYGGPCVVVDFGTATTFAAVSQDGEYLGGAIAPGIEVSMDALSRRAARLSRVELEDPGSVIGKSTMARQQAGAIYGFSGQVDGIVGRMREELGGEAVAVATGGLSALIYEHARSLDHLEPLLTLYGLEIIYRRNR